MSRFFLLFVLFSTSRFQAQDTLLNEVQLNHSPVTNSSHLIYVEHVYQRNLKSILSHAHRDIAVFSATENFYPTSSSYAFEQQLKSYEHPLYSGFISTLRKENQLQLKDNNFQINFVPILNFTVGKSLNDTLHPSQNTRGLQISGNTLNQNFQFKTAFYENQQFLPTFARKQAIDQGEFYPQGTNGYIQQNGMISGGARTKYFKDIGFDYAYAIGQIHWNSKNNTLFSLGNEPIFIGNGYRSLIWSDHSGPGMKFGFNVRKFSRFSFRSIRMRGQNLVRRPETVNVEAGFERKYMSFTQLTWLATKKLSLSFYETGTWLRDDSLQTNTISPLFFLPLIGNSAVQQLINNEANSQLGIDIKWNNAKIVGYLQMGTGLQKASEVIQIGLRGRLKERSLSMLQFEFNHAGNNAFAHRNSKINFTNQNLAMAHPAGNGFDELLIRTTWSKYSFFVSLSQHFFFKKRIETQVLLPVNSILNNGFEQAVFTNLELGYRLNRFQLLDAFLNLQYRKTSTFPIQEGAWISVGIRASMSNHYFDF